MADVHEPKAFLAEALALQDLLEADEARLGEVCAQKKQTEKKLVGLEKSIGKEKNQTVAARREEAETVFLQQQKVLDTQLRDVKAAREKARSQGVKARVAEQTKALREKNEALKKEQASLFKNNRVPGFYRSGLYYTLFMPRGAKEILLALFAFFLIFILLPAGVNLLIPGEAWWHWVLVYAADILLFAGLYLGILHSSKLKHGDVIRQGRTLRSTQKKNEKQIRHITRSLKRDKDDRLYDLESFDDRLTQLAAQDDELEAKRETAMHQFDTVTRSVLIDEIDAKYQAEMTELVQTKEALGKEEESLRARLLQEKTEAQSRFGAYIGSKNMTHDRLSRLAVFVETGEAKTVAEAVEKLEKA